MLAAGADDDGGGDGTSPTTAQALVDLPTDPFTLDVASGTVLATAGLGHSVHVEASGLDADTTYWYRFAVGNFESPVGRTRTLPPVDS